jgi:hypothetical protein
MKRMTLGVFAVLFLAFSVAVLFAQTLDFSGTWVGETDFPNTPGIDRVTMVLKKAGNSYSGTIVIAKAAEVPLDNFKVEDEDTITFYFPIKTESGTVKVKARLDFLNDKVDGESLMGAWTMESGDYGSLDLKRKK